MVLQREVSQRGERSPAENYGEVDKTDVKSDQGYMPWLNCLQRPANWRITICRERSHAVCPIVKIRLGRDIQGDLGLSLG